MTKTRPVRQRRMHIEALEGRLAMSGGAAALHWHGAEILAHKIPKTIPITLSGHVSVMNGLNVSVSGVSGKLGKVKVTGSGSGSLSGNQFEGGALMLSNSSGSVTLFLGLATAKHAGKNTKLKVIVTAESATGKYAGLDNAAGSVNVVIPDKTSAASSFKGTFNSFSSTAAGELGY
jgi:hypothetical protein